MMIKGSIRILFISLLIFLCLPVVAHQHPAGGDNLVHIKEIYERAVALSPEVLEATEGSVAQPYLKVGKQSIPLNSGFWDLVRGWIRLYRSEINEYCSCNINEEELIREAKDQIARGFFYSKIGRHLVHFTEHVVVEAYGLSAKYGKTALILKASAEVAETLLSIFVGGKGVHIICNMIDAMIIFMFRKSQIYARVFSNSGTLDRSRMLSMIRLAYVNRLMRKAQRRVFFYLESTSVNQGALHHVSAEGIRRNRRANWVNNLSERATPVLNRIREIDIQLENENLSERQRARLFRERARLSRRIESFTEVSRKSFFGQRYKRFLLLLSRKGKKDYLKGVDFSDKVTSTNWLWSLAIQENILERALISQAEESIHQIDSVTDLKKDGIRSGLAEEFSGNMQINARQAEHIQAVEQVLTDVEKIFDTSLSTKERFLLVSVIETVFVGFFEHYLRLVHNTLSQSTLGMNIWGRARLRWRLDRFIYHVFVYSDFLRTVALVKDQTKISSYKYESMENLLLFFDYLNRLHQLAHSDHLVKDELLARLDQNLRRVQSFQVNLEKRTVFSWNPFSALIPWCRSLVKAVQ